MGDEQAFLRMIQAAPDHDAPRLIYADWLEERGDPDRADFIRVQCAGASPNTPTDRLDDLLAEAKALWKKHRDEWERPLRSLGAQKVAFCRGLPEAVSITAADFLKHGDKLFSLAPIREIRFLQCRNVPALVACPSLRHLTSLDLSVNAIGVAEIQALAACPHLKNLRHLDLSYNHIGHAGVQALMASPHLGNLTALALAGNDLGDATAATLAACQHLRQLQSLRLSDNHIGDTGSAALAASTYMRELRSLDLCNNEIENAGASALAASLHLGQLTALDVSRNLIGGAGAWALATSCQLPCLVALDLYENLGLGDAVLAQIKRTMAERQVEPEGRGT